MGAISHAAVGVPSRAPGLRFARFGDERLARLVAGGDERAFAALYERYHQPLYRYCRSIVRDDTDAQDVLQSTFAGALVALRRAQRSAPVRPWLFRIAHNEAISLLRLRGDGQELSEASGRRVASAEDQVADRERFGLLVADLHELPERVRGALVMRELSGLSYEEIAVALSTSVGGAKQAVFDARRGLLEFAEGRAMACEAVRRSISDGDGRVLRGRRVRAHLRDCQRCAAFAKAIPARRAELQALVPVLPAAASAATLARVIGSGSGHGGGGAGALAAGAAGKTVGASIAAKSLVGVVILATAAAGVTGVLTPTHPRPASTHEHTIRSRPATRTALPASGPRAVGAVRGGAPHAAGHALGSLVAGRTLTSTSHGAAGVSTVSGTRQHGVGALGTLPSQTQGNPARAGARPACPAAPALGAPCSTTPSPRTSHPRHGQPSPAGRPASAHPGQGNGHASTTGVSSTTGVGASHGGGGGGVGPIATTIPSSGFPPVQVPRPVRRSSSAR